MPPFFDIIEGIGSQFPGILSDGDRVWNLDETSIDQEYGKKVKAFCDSRSHHGGSRAAATGSGKHVTAVIPTSASGKVCPFFIAQGKQVMSNWLQPLEDQSYQQADQETIGSLTNEYGSPRTVLSCVLTKDQWT